MDRLTVGSFIGIPLALALPALAEPPAGIWEPIRNNGLDGAYEVIDFDSIDPASIVDEVYGTQGTGPVGILGRNLQLGEGDNAAVIFPADLPPLDELDLGTPNADFVGPGQGIGGQADSPYANSTALGNVLVINEAAGFIDRNEDGVIDALDSPVASIGDAGLPGCPIVFDFSSTGPVTIVALTILDVDAKTSPAVVELFPSADGPPVVFSLPHVGDNGVATVGLGPTPDVIRMEVTLNGPGAIDNLVIVGPAPTGACCLPDGSCMVLAEAECLALGGDWQGAAVQCDAVNCPQPVAGCCFPRGTCQPLTEDECKSTGGSWLGFGIDCGTVECPQPQGACCLDAGNCFDVLEADCLLIGGIWQGFGTVCATFQCPQPVAACCLPDGSCVDLEEADCTAQGGAWQGFGNTCATVMCPQPDGACCLPDGSCVDDDAADCAVAGGTWQGFGTSCISFPDCPQPPAACCLADGSCVDLEEADCTAQGGAWQGFGNTCATVMCPQPDGACCFPDGMCQDLTDAACTGAGGVWQGFGTECAAFTCPQPDAACCFADGTCQELTEDACVAAGGTWQGFGILCAAANCPPPPGACCFPDGTCQDLTDAACAGAGGDGQGFGTSCATFTCPQPTAGCCFPDGTCQDLAQVACIAAGGIWQGLGISCATANCPQPDGACCFGNGTCQDLTPTACGAAGGQWQGVGTSCATFTCPAPRLDGTEKGSIVIFPKIELRWDAAGTLIQDTFIALANDYPADIRVQLYFVNGDPPLDADGAERAHPGWNWLDNRIVVTGNEPTCWSSLTGMPEGVSPFRALDPGFPPGRPDPEVPGERMLRGYVVAWAVNANGVELRWNHLAGVATIVNYPQGYAWEYNGFSFKAIETVPHGELTGTPGELNLDGVEFALAPSQLLMPFVPSGSASFSGPVMVNVDNDLTLLPLSADLRQESDGPITTKAHFDVWNANEVKFSGAYRCITCWDQTLLSNYGTPNHFTVTALQSDCARARIDGLASQLCDLDFDPSNNDTFPFPPGPGDTIDPRDVVSAPAALIGVRARLLEFGTTGMNAAAGQNLFGMGAEAAVIRYDISAAPQEAGWPPSTPNEWIEWVLQEIGMGDSAP